MNEVPDSHGSPWTLDWVTRTRGQLTSAERRALRRPIMASVLTYVVDRLTPHHRTVARDLVEPIAPDSRLARQAEECAQEQTPDLLGHGYRTWILGSCLSQVDGVALDAELFYAAALLHDTGLLTSVVGEDFTVRSAEVVHRACDGVADAASATAIADAVVAHATPGLSRDLEPLGYYVQTGALADLIGLRSRTLSKDHLRSLHERHPRHNANRTVAAAIRREARCVPEGRFALLDRLGFSLLVRASPTRRFP